jgi:hypothetical protein
MILQFFNSILLVHSFLSLNSINRNEFYDDLGSSSVDVISMNIQKLNSKKSNENNAWRAAFIMKDANFQKTIKEKSTRFTEGKTLLENCISKENKNTEFRLLRLIIQENAPSILKYKKNISDDSKFIKSNYKKCDQSVIDIVKKYDKISKSLTL